MIKLDRETIKSFLYSHARIVTILGVFFFSFFMALLINVTWSEIPSDIEVDKIARQDIRADKDYNIVDEDETANLREHAVRNVSPVFDWDEDLGDEKIIEHRDILNSWKEKGITVRRIKQANMPRYNLKDFSDIISVEEARIRHQRGDLKSEVVANFKYNEEETRLQQEKAFEEVKPDIIPIQAGQNIIRMGDRFDAKHIKIIEGIRKQRSELVGRTRILGSFLFVGLISTVFVFLFQRIARRTKLGVKELLFQGTLLLALVLVERLVVFISGAIHGLLPTEIPLNSFYVLVPMAAGAMMVRYVLPVPIALLYSGVGSIVAGLVLQSSWSFTLYFLLSSIMGIVFMSQARNRSQILTVGLKLGAFNIVNLMVLDLLNVSTVGGGVIDSYDTLWRSCLAFLSGPFCSIILLILMPIFETTFNYLTPIKLLEYGSLNHPVLRELIMRAPGTYHHSHMVGTLAEAGCEAIGADSLFARVASYFHDIGKLKKSHYFIENMPAGEDRHAILSPSMSVLIIQSHVKDGIEMARDYKLPQRIIDIIPQHQGTKLISYFFNKAKQSEDKDTQVVDEKEFRYPGPKPQSREAGVILLADTIEAATRALKDRSSARIEEVVHNMINKNFIDGQLDECELTLKDLNKIAQAFVRTLVGVYHQRIEYPPDQADKDARINPVVQLHGDKFVQPKPFGSPVSQKNTKEAS